ncbi:MAG: 50S ribosomal protein L21 [Mycoplasmataceae bacterium]|nr:MAG: 50S ribosomal protein L21 [Mycoplasmataceae bacterium]
MSSFKSVVFEIKGKQYNIVENNQVIYIDYQKDKNSGDKILFPRVLSFNEEFGQPYLENITVTGEVIKHRKLKKITIFKYKPKKRTTKKQGFRPQYTEVKIVSVEKV